MSSLSHTLSSISDQIRSVCCCSLSVDLHLRLDRSIAVVFLFRFPDHPSQIRSIVHVIYNGFGESNLKRSCEILRKRMQNNNSFHEDSFQVRKLEISDKSKGFIELLQQLTVCDSVSEKQFEERFRELSSYGDDHLICVIEDNRSGKIVATGSVFTEKKFIRNCGKVGHIEDVVVDSSARGMQLGKKIVEVLIDHARSTGCYKVILDCSTDNRVFYEKCGFKQKEIQMVKYFI
ncbi:unnamed protein product [Camellia sinensis]